MDTLEGEVWKPIPGFDGYMVSSLGRVWSLKTDRLRAQRIGHHGYMYVTMRIGKEEYCKTVHRLVLSTFKGNGGTLQTRHLNSIRTDNRIDNLMWGTQKENFADMSRETKQKKAADLSARMNERGRQGLIKTKYTDEQVRQMRNEYVPGVFGVVRLARKWNESPKRMREIVLRLRYQWVDNAHPHDPKVLPSNPING